MAALLPGRSSGVTFSLSERLQNGLLNDGSVKSAYQPVARK